MRKVSFIMKAEPEIWQVFNAAVALKEKVQTSRACVHWLLACKRKRASYPWCKNWRCAVKKRSGISAGDSKCLSGFHRKQLLLSFNKLKQDCSYKMVLTDHVNNLLWTHLHSFPLSAGFYLFDICLHVWKRMSRMEQCNMHNLRADAELAPEDRAVYLGAAAGPARRSPASPTLV